MNNSLHLCLDPLGSRLPFGFSNKNCVPISDRVPHAPSIYLAGGLLHHSQSRETIKYGHESCGTRNQERLCWRGPAAIYPTRLDTVYLILPVLWADLYTLTLAPLPFQFSLPHLHTHTHSILNSRNDLCFICISCIIDVSELHILRNNLQTIRNCTFRFLGKHG
jgi:hypothetical protein